MIWGYLNVLSDDAPFHVVSVLRLEQAQVPEIVDVERCHVRGPAVEGNGWENQALFDFDGKALLMLAEYLNP